MRTTTLGTTGTGALVAVTALALLTTGGTPPVGASRSSADGPTVQLLSGPADRTPARRAAFTFAASEPEVQYAARLDDGGWTAWRTRPAVDFRRLGAGAHAVEVKARSDAGVVGPVVRTDFVVDLSAPQTAIPAARRAATTFRRTSSLDLAASERGSTFTCSVDGARYTGCTSPYPLTHLSPGRHTLAVKATDEAGNTDATAVTRDIVVQQAVTEGTLFSDDFEAGNLAKWSVTAQGTGQATAQSSVVRTGSYAARLAATADTGSRAYARATLAAAVPDLTVTAAVRVDTAGASGGNVPLLRVFDDAGTRTVSLYRANNAAGEVWVNYAGQHLKTSATLPLATWATFSLRVSGAAVQVTKNGSSAFSGTGVAAASRTVQLGNEVAAQAGVLYADDVSVTSTSGDTSPPETTLTSAPSGTVPHGSATLAFTSSEPGTFQCSLDAGAWATCTSPKSYSGLASGSHTFRVRAIDAAGNVDPSPATATWTSSPSQVDAVLVADNQNRRIVITDYSGQVLWKWDNPTGESSPYSGPLGVRWMANGHILATFGTGKVGEIDPATKTFLWMTAGYHQDWFQSPYDAQLMPDGNLAVASARNEGGRVAIYNRSTGALVWKRLVNYAKTLEMVPAGQGTNTSHPTLFVAGNTPVSEVVYAPGQAQDRQVVYTGPSASNVHRVILDRDGRSIVYGNWDTLLKVARPTQSVVWSRFQGNPSNGEVRGTGLTTDGGYVIGYRVWNGPTQLRFLDGNGNFVKNVSTLSDGSRLNLVWGLRTITWAG